MHAHMYTMYKKQNLEHNCVLQESRQISFVLVKGGHCVVDCINTCNKEYYYI